jgi:hypothetical protein
MYKVLTVSMTVLLLAGATVWAQPTHDTFWVTLEGDNQSYGGGGSGWNAIGGEGEWIYYSQSDWWSQWFYNDPPDPDRWKEISYDIFLEPWTGGTEGVDLLVEVALNWSTIDFPQSGPNGSPPLTGEEQFIERWEIYQGSTAEPQNIIGDYVIPDYNPEWVSIDVRVYAWGEIEMPGPGGGEPGFEWMPMQVNMTGDIWHECVPEPATLGLLLIGGLALLRRKRLG